MLAGVGISQQFGGLAALTNVSVDVASGEIVGLIGPNGAGKTTLFCTISGLMRPTAGHVRLKGSGLGRHGGRAAVEAFTEVRWISLRTERRHYPFDR